MDAQEKIEQYRKEIGAIDEKRWQKLIEKRKVIGIIFEQLIDMIGVNKITLFRITYSSGWINEKSLIDFNAIKDFDLPIYFHTICHRETGEKLIYLFSKGGDFLLKVDSSVLYNKA